jgi:uncharacterized protein involved in exopolysaccharide biosynthesis
MTALQTFGPQQPVDSERASSFDLAHYFGIFKRRIFYFAIPFVLLLIVGFLVSAIQRPIFHAEGKILVESPEIPTDLVRPTVTAVATERIQVIQQRIMNRDNLLAIVKKFNLFTSEQRWMSGTQLLDLMRERAEIQLVDIDTAISPTKDGKPAPRPNNKGNSAMAFTISFEYETPELAQKVANEFLTLILDEDVRARTARATETTQFLAREVKRLQSELDRVNLQVAEMKRTDLNQDASEKLKSQLALLNAMKADVIQKGSVYSEAHPALKSLRKRIAALEHEIAQAPKIEVSSSTGGATLEDLEQQQTSIQNSLEDASKKLGAARMGESMERNQQSEHLQVIEQPAVPQKPIKPKRLKLFVMSFAFATMAGFGTIFLAEMLDKSIRGSRDLVGVIDSQLLVVIPYISTAGEQLQKKRRMIVLWAGLVVALLLGLAVAFYIGVQIDFSWFDRPWIDALTRLSK